MYMCLGQIDGVFKLVSHKVNADMLN